MSRWNKSDLDHVLTEGDLLYALLIYYMLTADDLTRSIVMCNIEFPVDFLELKTEIAHLRNGESFLRRSVPNTGDEFMFLLFMGGFTTALMKHDNHFYLLILIVETRMESQHGAVLFSVAVYSFQYL